MPPTPKVAGSAQRRVPISELPEYAQLAFAGVKELNQLQSAVCATALHSNENMLVCAPTGAGKTNVALLAVMQQVAQCMEHGVLDREALKVVYVAPMKALAQEVVAKFGKSLAPLGLQVREYTGDMQLTKREIVATQLIVTTPEKSNPNPNPNPNPSPNPNPNPNPPHGRCASGRWASAARVRRTKGR